MNFDHPLRRELVTGMSGSGKTSLALHLARDWPARWKFLFDPDREFSRKLGWPLAIDQGEVVRLASQFRPVCFDPTALIAAGSFAPKKESDPEPQQAALDHFCGLVLRMSRKVHGVKLLVVDEIWKYTGRKLPGNFRMILHEGRRQEIDTLIVSQQLNDTNSTLRGQCSRLWTFRQDEELPLDWLRRAGFAPDQVSALPYPGGFALKDRTKGTMVLGKTEYSGAPKFAPERGGRHPGVGAANSPARQIS